MEQLTFTESPVPRDGKSEPSVTLRNRYLCKAIKIAFLGICVTGFTYQAVVFFTHFYGYPTIVELDVQSPETFVTPALTFCNLNRFKRSSYCAKHPDNCAKPEDMQKFCREKPHYCKRNISNFMIPKLQFYLMKELVNVTEAEVHEMGTFFRHANNKSIIEGPIYFKNDKTLEGFPCFSLHSRIQSSLEPDTQKLNRQGTISLGSYTLNVEEDEIFDPRQTPGALFSMHSPYEAVNPDFKGTFMKPGFTYKVHVRLEEEHYLPYPYKSDCIDYEKLWLANNRTGVRSKQMCRNLCETEFSLFCWGCLKIPLFYRKPEDVCLTSVKPVCNGTEDKWEELSLCFGHCKKECKKLKYLYTVEERSTVQEIFNMDGRDFIYVDIYVDDPEINVITHKPQYQDVELFSYLGGFLGCWLGVSIWTFVGAMEQVMKRITKTVEGYKKRTNTKK